MHDNALSALDYDEKMTVFEKLNDYLEENKCGLVFAVSRETGSGDSEFSCVSMELDGVKKLCQKVVILAKGRIVEQGPIDALSQDKDSVYARLV